MKNCTYQGRCNTLRVIYLRNLAMISRHGHKLICHFLTFCTAKRAELPLNVTSKKTFFESLYLEGNIKI